MMRDSERLPWFPCEPGPLLGALAGMRAPKQLVYLTILLRIYENGGACPDTVDALATRMRLNRKVVTESMDELVREGRLFVTDDGIRNPKADRVMESTITLREKRKRASAKAGSASAEKRKENQQTNSTKRCEIVDQPSTHLHLHKQEEDSLFSIENRVPGSDPESDKPKVAALPLSDWPADYREQFWSGFPRKTEKKSAMAKLDAIKKSGLIPWARFIAGVFRYRNHSAGTEERYIKHPTTWLNRGCWDDEHPEQKQQSSGEGRSHIASQPRQTREDAILAGVGRFANRYLNPEQPAGRDGPPFDIVDVTPNSFTNR